MSEIFDEVHLLEGSKEWYGIATKFQTDLNVLEMQQLSAVNFNKILKFISEKNLLATDLTIIMRPVTLNVMCQDLSEAGTLAIKFKGIKIGSNEPY